MKLATPSDLKRITGASDPQEQYETLLELGIRPIFKGGRVRVYQEVIIRAMLSNHGQIKPKLNI